MATLDMSTAQPVDDQTPDSGQSQNPAPVKLDMSTAQPIAAPTSNPPSVTLNMDTAVPASAETPTGPVASTWTRLKNAADSTWNEVKTGAETAAHEAFTTPIPELVMKPFGEKGKIAGQMADIGSPEGLSYLLNDALYSHLSKSSNSVIAGTGKTLQGFQNAEEESIRQSKTPAGLAMLLSGLEIEKIPGFVADLAESTPAIAKYAPAVKTAARGALTSLNGYFSYAQIKDAIKAEPKILSAIATGDTEGAVRMTTDSLTELGLGLYGGYHTARGGFETVNDLSKNKAFEQSEDLKNVAHNRQEVNQTTVARKETLKTLADKQIPDRLGQEWTSEYIEANQDRAELAKRQAETAAGPKPSDAIAAAQGEDIPLDEQVANKTAFELRSDTPQDKLPKGATAQSAVDHEAGHVIVTKLVGGKSGEIQSYLHPEVSGRTSARTTVDFSGLQEDLSDDPEVAAEQVKNIVINKKAPAIMAGAAVDELLHGIPLEQNKGLAGDLEAIKNDCEAIGIGDEWTTVARRGFEQAKKLLQQSGMLDILQKHTATRDEGLSETLLMHEDRVQQMEEEAKNLHEQNQKGIERNNEESARPNGINLVPGGQRAVGGETNNGGILPVAEGQRPEIAYRAKEIYAGRKDNQIGTSAVPESGAGREGREGIRRGTSETLPVSRNAGHIAPEEITYRTDANGTRWASSPDSPAEVSIPKNLTGPEAESYARDKLELQKNFATNRSLELTKDKEPTEAASVHAKEIQEALLEARSNAQRRVTTPEERQKIALQQDPKRPITPKQQKYIDYRTKVMGQVADELQEHGLLESGRRRPNYVMHALEGADDATNTALQRVFPTMHEGRQAGFRYHSAIGDLDSDAVGIAGRKIADARTVRGLLAGRMNNGSPLAVPGGYVEGQRVSTEPPTQRPLSEQDVNQLTRTRRLAGLIKSGRVIQNPDKSFSVKLDDYEPLGIYQQVPIGSTPIPPATVQEMKENGSLATLEKKGVIYQNANGNYFNKEPLYARVELYGHPDVAGYIRDSMIGDYEPNTTGKFAALGKTYDYLQKNMKSLLIAWSPFHRGTEAFRILNTLGLKEGGKNIFVPPPDVDYFNLSPQDKFAINSGIVISNPRGYSPSNVKSNTDISEGLGVTADTWGAKAYSAFNKILEKIGVPASVRSKIDPQKILTTDVFGPNGQITKYKFAAFKNLQPAVETAMEKLHPDWTPEQLRAESGRETARLINNKFGGYNNVLAGRTLRDQKWLRRALFAPDFLETSGRSVLDLASPYGSPLLARMIQFQLAAALTAGAINYAIHHDPKDHSVMGAIKASHLGDHPGHVVSKDGRTEYSIRTAEGDFMHMLNAPKQFTYTRLGPLLKSTWEMGTQKNQYGRSETMGEAAKSFAKSTVPLPIQPYVGLNSGTISEPSKTDQALKSLGIGGYPIRSDAENLAIQKVSQHLEGQPELTGQQLVRSQLRLKAEDRLRDAYAIQDLAKKTAAVNAAKADIANLTMRKLISPPDQKKILTDARISRLASIFNSLDPKDALDVWGAGTDEEKQQLGLMMHAKFARWMDELSKRGYSINNMPDDYQQTFNRFRQASTDLTNLEHKPKITLDMSTAQPLETAPTTAINSVTSKILDAVKKHATPTAQFKSPNVEPQDLPTIISDAATKYGVDLALVNEVIKHESNNDSMAVSNKNARGLMQLRPITAKQYGVTDINDPEQNIDAGVHYLSDLIKRYKGNVRLALAAYNAGPGAVSNYNGVPPFKETRNYVNRIMKKAGNK